MPLLCLEPRGLQRMKRKAKSKTSRDWISRNMKNVWWKRGEKRSSCQRPRRLEVLRVYTFPSTSSIVFISDTARNPSMTHHTLQCCEPGFERRGGEGLTPKSCLIIPEVLLPMACGYEWRMRIQWVGNRGGSHPDMMTAEVTVCIRPVLTTLPRSQPDLKVGGALIMVQLPPNSLGLFLKIHNDLKRHHPVRLTHK